MLLKHCEHFNPQQLSAVSSNAETRNMNLSEKNGDFPSERRVLLEKSMAADCLSCPDTGRMTRQDQLPWNDLPRPLSGDRAKVCTSLPKLHASSGARRFRFLRRTFQRTKTLKPPQLRVASIDLCGPSAERARSLAQTPAGQEQHSSTALHPARGADEPLSRWGLSFVYMCVRGCPGNRRCQAGPGRAGPS